MNLKKSKENRMMMEKTIDNQDKNYPFDVDQDNLQKIKMM